ncbi:omega-amidase NIT2 [Fopius arisanus]|uniref:omega-amidase n=1 Tax=Fopius arisanus TaxID=64838 RepID=A0A9R1TJM2_9HYME|nr:PREDICTED: omega-amidase NIT2 [Fopius arisanus]
MQRILPVFSSNTRSMSSFRLALAQLSVGTDKSSNIDNAVSHINQAKKQEADVVVLPECFNSPYGTQHFKKYAEAIPSGETCAALSKAARDNKILVIGGTIPERDDDKLYNTCTVWDSEGKLIAKHRKMHLFDIDIKDKMTFFESETLSPGDDITIFEFRGCKIGIGICYDIRFEEMAKLYRNRGCHMLVYPAAFNLTTGPLHWELLQRSRANDNQCFVVCVSPARGKGPGYIAWGHSQLTSPWARVICDLGTEQNLEVAEINLEEVEEVRSQIPISNQRRTDIYDTIYKK